MDWTNNETITLPVWYHLRWRKMKAVMKKSAYRKRMAGKIKERACFASLICTLMLLLTCRGGEFRCAGLREQII